jgi:allantoate deiminase
MSPPTGPRIEPGGARASARLQALNAASDAQDGLTRLTLTPAHRRALDMLGDFMREAGLAVRLDGAGTLVGRCEGPEADSKTLLIGSHIDSVRNAGSFDGPLGVVLGIEAMALLRARGVRLPFAVEILAFGDEEGVRFATTLTGSRALAGAFDPASLDSRDAQGVSRREALVAFGCDPDRIAHEARDPARTLGYVEVHIEQGPVLERRGLALGLVTAINGASRGEIAVTGEAGHSGTTPMAMRRDAGVAAAQIVLAVEEIARATPDLVATVGRIEIPHGAVNVVPGAARLSLDVRSPRDGDRLAAVEAIRARAQEIARSRGVGVTMDMSYDMPAAPCDPALTQALAQAAQRLGHADFRLPSGAGHDAMAFRGRLPLAMLFVRCRGGVSHRPDEYASPQDIESALAALTDFIEHLGAGS